MICAREIMMAETDPALTELKFLKTLTSSPGISCYL